MASVKFKSNAQALKLDLRRRASLFLRIAVAAVGDEADPKTPKRLGNLRRDKLEQVLGLHGRIEWRKRYAAVQEEKQHRRYTTPGTGPHYAENAVTKVVNDSRRYMRQAGLV